MRRVLQSAHGSVPWREPQAALELTLAHLRRSAMAAALLALIVAAALSGGLSTGHSVVASRTRPRVAHGGLAGLSAPARDALLQKLGASDPAYRIEASAGGYRAVNPSQGLRLGFSRSGVLVGAGALRLRLSVRALGYGSSLRALGEGPAPQVKADRVRYTRGGLSEWYVNGPLGLEQGFTIARAPAGVADGPLTLSIALSGNAQATLASDRQSLTLASSGAPRLRYGDLLARDANGRVLHSWLALGATGVLLRVDARDARYPLTLDPLVQQGQKLTGAGEAGAGQFGYSVALSADGNTALIGAPADNANAGAAWVFTRSGSGWTQQGEKLTGGGETGEGGFGSSVALSADGGTALVGGPADDSRAGAAWVFTRSGSGWTQQGAKLTPRFVISC